MTTIYPVSVIIRPLPIPIIKQPELTKDVISPLISNFLGSEHRDVLENLMDFVIASYHQNSYEASLSLIYSATEMLISHLARYHKMEYLMTGSRFKKFTKHLKPDHLKPDIEKALEIVLTSTEESETTEIVEEIKKKIQELRRPSFETLFMNLTKLYDIDLRNYWHEGADIESEFSQLRKRRNEYIHNGSLVDRYLCQQDMCRLRYLVSTWILMLLKCQPDKFSEKHGDIFFARRKI